jgi:DNA-binding NtrC family response regulator
MILNSIKSNARNFRHAGLPQTASRSKDAGEFPITRQTQRTILAVNDVADLLEIVRKITKRLLEQAGSGEEAISLFTRHKEPIDLLLTDVVMPMLSGKDVADQIKSVHPETKVLYMSGYTDEAIVHHGIVDADIEFIQKPFTERALTRKIREVLNAGTPPGELSDGFVDESGDG